MVNNFKDIDIKSRAHYFFDGMININGKFP